MKVYFSTSATNLFHKRRDNKENIDFIVELIEKEGHKRIKRPLVKGYDEEISSEIEDQYSYLFEYRKNAKDVNKAVRKSISSCDVAVFENSYPAEGVGFELGYALSQKKPVIALIDRSRRKFLSDVIEGISTTYFQIEYYTQQNEIENSLSNFFENAKKYLDTKFILIIPSEIDRYLEWASSEKRLHKAQIVRESVEDLMDKDEEWKAFRKQQENS